MKFDWLYIARTIQSIGQSGLTYTENQYDVERYKQLLDISSAIVANSSTLDQEQTRIDFLNQKGYATPKIDIRGVIMKNEKLLLVQEAADSRWCLPGGWADVGESPSAAIKREVFEEAGLNVLVKYIIGVYDANKDGRDLSLYHAYKIVFLCETIDGELKTSNETIAVDYFDRNNLPELSQSRTNMRHLDDVYNFVEKKNKLVKFD